MSLIRIYSNRPVAMIYFAYTKYYTMSVRSCALYGLPSRSPITGLWLFLKGNRDEMAVSTLLRVTDAMNILQLFSVGAEALVRPSIAFLMTDPVILARRDGVSDTNSLTF